MNEAVLAKMAQKREAGYRNLAAKSEHCFYETDTGTDQSSS